ncbi:hypothetical protein SAMN04487947_1503 [Halogeometricum rufum]|uniref:Uncharacterized protein n=1 Tax=Halogeometricum rufum TaxID=553469 RepID=A0A1I6GQ09_9EURY|nr:hypothetical protein [Halogeometricum rufum]SFR44322.1 hypothetical protein SAMN04487947_1503 [Halogeometricum rufum]
MGLDDFSKDDDEPASVTETQQNRVMGQHKRREEFKKQLRECNDINTVTDGQKRNVCTARTESGDALVWMHYSKAFNFWGGSVRKNDELRIRGPALVHAFLGAKAQEYYVVPDKELHSGDFYMPVQDKNGSEHWRLAGKGDGGRNRELLDANYSSLCAPFR